MITNKYLEKAREKKASLIVGALATHLAQNAGTQAALKSRATAKYLANAFSEGVHGVVDNSVKAKAIKAALGAGLPDLVSAHKTMHDLGRGMSELLRRATPRQKAGIRMLTEGKFDKIERFGLHKDPVVQKAHAHISKHIPIPSLDNAAAKGRAVQHLWNDPSHPLLSNILKNSGRGHVPAGPKFVKGTAGTKFQAAGAVGSAIVDPAAGALNTAKALMVSKPVKQNKLGARVVNFLESQFVKNPIKSGLKAKKEPSALEHNLMALGVNPVSAHLKRTSAALADAL